MTTEWEISFEEYLDRMKFSSEDFKHHWQLPKFGSIKKIIPFKNMEKINFAIPLRTDFLEKIIRGLKTNDNKEKPFRASTIELVKMDPKQLKIGQKFVYREQYQNLLENIPAIFREFLICAGFCDLGAFMLFGPDAQQNNCLAYYIPPIIEKHKNDLIIMDGIHRNFINKQIGHTLNAILIDNVSVPFPCSFHSWEEIRVIPLKNKPKDITKRYFDLKPGLFRDLKYLGIDG